MGSACSKSVYRVPTPTHTSVESDTSAPHPQATETPVEDPSPEEAAQARTPSQEPIAVHEESKDEMFGFGKKKKDAEKQVSTSQGF